MSEIAHMKGKRGRSPSFPFVPLGMAIDRLGTFEEYFKRHPAPADKVGLAWGMKAGSSQALQTVAALKAFGLIDTQRSSDGGTFFVVSDDGRTYLRAQQESTKADVLKRAAVKPKLIGSYWREWGADRPPDPVCLDDLVLKEHFTAEGAATFLKVYDQTIALAKLGIPDKRGPVEHAKDVENLDGSSLPPDTDDARSKAKVGDYVQWTSMGMDQFVVPARVVWVSDDGAYLRVEGNSKTIIPMNHVEVTQPPPKEPLSSDSATAANHIQVLLDGNRLRITASVDRKGLTRLKKIIDANEPLLEDDN